MKTPILLCSVTTLAFFAGGAFSTQESMSGSPMEAMAAMHQPGSYHEMLAPFAGTWKAQATFYMGPQTMESTGTMKNSWIHDGRFLLQEYEGEFMGSTFHGTGYWGYSNTDKTYQGFWIDDMTTSMSFSSTGTASEDGKTFTMNGSERNPMTGKSEAVKDVITVHGADKHTFTRMTGGQKQMEIVYTKM